MAFNIWQLRMLLDKREAIALSNYQGSLCRLELKDGLVILAKVKEVNRVEVVTWYEKNPDTGEETVSRRIPWTHIKKIEVVADP